MNPQQFKDVMYVKLLLQTSGKNKEEILEILESGKFICPNCFTIYEPKYKSREMAEFFKDDDGKHQWISHVCKTKCLYQMLGMVP